MIRFSAIAFTALALAVTPVLAKSKKKEEAANPLAALAKALTPDESKGKKKSRPETVGAAPAEPAKEEKPVAALEEKKTDAKVDVAALPAYPVTDSERRSGSDDGVPAGAATTQGPASKTTANPTVDAKSETAVIAIPPAKVWLPGSLDSLVSRHASAHGVPESLVRRVIHRESRGNARAVANGNYGLMQIRLGTARSMGYRGDASGLLDADTNMTYAVKYLAGAYKAAGGNENQAIRYYASGYYYAAKAKGLIAPSPKGITGSFASADDDGKTKPGAPSH